MEALQYAPVGLNAHVTVCQLSCLITAGTSPWYSNVVLASGEATCLAPLRNCLAIG